jgi:predicted hotdog family 3-hydroxylacyl-ACP dehydratase
MSTEVNKADWTIHELVPHAGRMRLLSELVQVEAESLCAHVRISEQDLFYDAALGGVGAWVGIEYMAQAVAAWAGWQGRQSDQAPKIGLLLGSRKYRCERALFLPGETLEVRTRREFQADNGLGQFACEIWLEGQQIATAALTVFGPANPEQFLQGEGAQDE